MHRRTFFSINVAIFILTWTQFTVMGIPKTRFQLCKDLGFDTACEMDNERFPCAYLTCGRGDIFLGFQRSNRFFPNGVPDRTKCGPSKVCLDKKCVPIDGPMPQYFGNDTFSPCFKKRHLDIEPIPTRHEQCKDFGFDVACEQARHGLFSCRHLACGYETRRGSYMLITRSSCPIPLYPITGTRCGDNKVCYKNRCIPLSEFPKPEQIQYTGEEILHKCT